MSDHPLPSFFLVGAPKAATSSIYHYLGQHPEIFVPEIKEPHYFACPEVKDTYYSVPLVDDEEAYRGLYESAGGRIAGDFSPSYLFRNEAAKRIKDWCSDAKILMILRNPVDRAISHYLMDVRFGYNSLSLLDILRNPELHTTFFREYVEVGRYADQVTRYLDIFGPSQVQIHLYDDVTSNIRGVLGEMLEFIGARTDFVFELGHAHNEHRVYRFGMLPHALASGVGQRLLKYLPRGVKDFGKQIATSHKKPDLSAERQLLQDLLKDDVRKLQDLIGRDLSHWLEPTKQDGPIAILSGETSSPDLMPRP